MKKFEFRLQRVLDIKQTIEDAKRNDFNLAMKKYLDEKAKLQAILNEKKEYALKLNSLKDANEDKKKISLFYDYLASLSQRELYQNKLIDLASEEVEKRREILTEAVKEKRIVEKLKQKKIVEYRYEINKDEQNSLDEISGTKFFKAHNLENVK